MAGDGGVFSTHGQVTIEGKPFVVTFVNDEPFGQLSPKEAVALGVRAISAAIEAERDAGLVRFFKERLEMDDVALSAVIAGMREYREQTDLPDGSGN
jgi:hypothetical protein